MAPELAAHPTADDPGIGGRPVRVLVVEDHPASALLVCAMLATRPGYVSEVLSSLGDAARALGDAAALPDVVLCDVQLPDGCGLELVGTGVHGLRHDVPVVFLTADASAARAEEVAALNARLLVKPFSDSALFEAVNDAVSRVPPDAGLHAGPHAGP